MIRLATPADLAACVALAREFHDEFHAELLPFDAVEASASLWPVLHAPFSRVLDDGGAVRGALLLRRMTDWYTSQLSLFDVMFYVGKESRGGTAALDMLKSAKAMAETEGMRLTMGTIVGDPDVHDRLFRMAGLRRIGGVYVGGP